MKVSSFTLLAVIGLAFASVAPAQAGNPHGDLDKVQFCHANNGSKAYSFVDTSIDAVVDVKTGNPKGHGVDTGDIIPAFNWKYEGVRYYFDGLNLDKAGLINRDTKSCAAVGTVHPNAPTYLPASCTTNPKAPYGTVIVPVNLGDGIKSASEPKLNGDKSVWNVNYTLKDSDDEFTYSWPANVNGAYNFTVVPITADKYYVVDSKTGVGACELPDTGASQNLLTYGGIGAGILVLGALFMGTKLIRRRRS